MQNISSQQIQLGRKMIIVEVEQASMPNHSSMETKEFE